MEVKATPIATLFAALFAANAIDTMATHFALGLGVHEANPFVLAILDVFGIAGVALAKLALILILGTLLFWERPKIWTRVYLWTATLTYTALTIYHGFGLYSVTQIT